MANSNKDDNSLRTFFWLAMSSPYSPELLSEILCLEHKANLRTYRYIFNASPGTPHFSEDRITEHHPLSHSIPETFSKSNPFCRTGCQLESGDGQLEWDIPVESGAEFIFSVIYDGDSPIAAPLLQQDTDTKQALHKNVSFSPEAGSLIITPSGSIKQTWQWRLLLNGKGTATISTPTEGHCVPALSGWHNHDARFPNECGQTILRFPAQNKKYNSLKKELARTLSSIIQHAEKNKKITLHSHALTNEHSLRKQLNSALPWLTKNYGQDFLSKRQYHRPLIPPPGQYFYVFHNPSQYCEGLSKPQIERPSRNDSMKSEFARLSSFSSFPFIQHLANVALARVGFYYTDTNKGVTTECKCFCCGCTYTNWKEHDNPYDIHRQISPNCAYMTGAQSNNDPIHDEDKKTPRRTLQVPLTKSLADIALPIQQLRIAEDPSDANIAVNTYDNTTESTFVKNSANLTAVSESTPNINHHQGHIYGNKPRYPDYISHEARINSYTNWPTYLTQKPEDMAAAGFFCANTHDYVRCFFCGGGLRNWEPGDDPLVEHAHWFPKCAYLLKKKEDDLKLLNPPTTPENGISHNALASATLIQPQHHNITESSHPSVNITSTSNNNTTENTPTNNRNGITTGSNYSENSNLYQYAHKHPYYSDIWVRRNTYKNWPIYLNNMPDALAEAGFYSTDHEDYTRCFHCGGGLRNWEPNDDPFVEHARWFPKCEYLVRCKGPAFIVLVQRSQEKHEKETQNALNEAGGQQPLNTPVDSENGISHNALTSTPLIQPQRHNITESSSSSVYIASTSNNNTTENTPTNNRNDLTTGSNCSENSNIDQNSSKPKYPTYSSLTIRQASYKNWPHALRCMSEALAQAGFLYAATHDLVRCFHCSVGLRNWELGDEPFVEHARWSPKCEYLLECKGPEFIHLVQTKHKKQIAEEKAQERENALKKAGGQQPLNTSNNPENGISNNDLTLTNAPLVQPQRNDLTESASANNSNNFTTGYDYFLNSSIGTMGVNLDTLANPSYKELSVRINTFSNFPTRYAKMTKNMAEAGLWYTGDRTRTNCYCCDTTIYDWGILDDPWVRHAQQASECAHVVAQRDACLEYNRQREDRLKKEMHEAHEQKSLNTPNTNNIEGQAAATNKGYRGESIQHADEQSFCVTATPEQTTNEQLCSFLEKGAQFLKGYDHTITPAAIEEAVIRLKDKLLNQQDLDIKNLQNLMGTHIYAMIDIINEERSVIKRLQEKGFNIANTNAAIKRFNSEMSPLTLTIDITEEKITNFIHELEIKEKSCQNYSSISNSELEAKADMPDTQERAELERERNELQELYKCKICNRLEVAFTLAPCGHFCCCASCVTSTKKCPLCKVSVQSVIKTNLNQCRE
ncbi:MAG: RING-HC finger protein [Candidatus Endonucleobacter bathymodioli]|uniref:RING-HC finger protein n=1 Tax=Candidatus Endonucleibacter bathymodioli TaxID=539814 RepID=A0AA90NNN6_9GAMM|nr:RING-HC finger protein [Candidatus Endonucleobacter bathymodioli]